MPRSPTSGLSIEGAVVGAGRTKALNGVIDVASTAPRPSPLRGLLPVDRLMSVAEVATVLLVSEQTVNRAIRDGKLKAFKIGRQIRIHPKDINDYVANSVMSREPSDLDAFITTNTEG